MNTIARTSHPTTQSTVAEQLARFAIEQKEFPENAIREAKRIILDQLACQVMFAVSPPTKCVMKYRRRPTTAAAKTALSLPYRSHERPATASSPPDGECAASVPPACG